jgi:uncharacterized protein
MPVFSHVPQEQFLADVAALAAAIGADAWRPDWLVGIGRGGLVPAVYLSHATGLPMRSCDLAAPDAAEVLTRLAGRAWGGERLLFVDDINDSGRTVARLRDSLGRRETIRFATLLDNVASAERVDYAARTLDRRVTKDWFVFPWEAVAPAAAHEADAAEVPDRIA